MRSGRGVVVCDDLNLLRVAFTGQQHIGSGPFEHRDQIGQDIALCIKVFHDLKNPGPLPLPPVQLRFEVVAVTLPHGDVAPCQSGGWLIGYIGTDDQRIVIFRSEPFQFPVVLRSERMGYQRFDRLAFCIQDNLFFLEIGG